MSHSKQSKKRTPQRTVKKYIRYEIYIPTYDNYGNKFPEKYFVVTGTELKSLLGDYSISSDVNIGTWTMNNGSTVVDETIKIYADIPVNKKTKVDIALIGHVINFV